MTIFNCAGNLMTSLINCGVDVSPPPVTESLRTDTWVEDDDDARDEVVNE